MKWDKTLSSRSLKGFTIIEVVLVIGITGLIFIGAVVGVGDTIARQRYNDAVNDVSQSLRDQYTEAGRVHIHSRPANRNSTAIDYCQQIFGVDAVQANDRGRTDCNVYGSALILGAENGTLIQNTELIGKDFNYYRDSLILDPILGLGNVGAVESYLLRKNDVQILGELGVNNSFRITEPHSPSREISIATDVNFYKTMPWGTRLEWPDGNAAKALILIVRSPRDGTMHSYVHKLDNDVEVYNYKNHARNSVVEDRQNINKILNGGGTSFAPEELYLCIDMMDGPSTARRRTIHIAKNAHTASSVELVDFDQDKEDFDGTDPNNKYQDKCNERL